MTRYYRVSLGKGGKYASEARTGGWVGTGWLGDIDLTGKFPDTWKAFNKVHIPILLGIHESTSKIGAGLACGMTWIVCKGIQVGDVVLSSNGLGQFQVGKITGDYFYSPSEPLSHRRPIVSYPNTLNRTAMSEGLSRTLGDRFAMLEGYDKELERRKFCCVCVGETPRRLPCVELEEHRT